MSIDMKRQELTCGNCTLYPNHFRKIRPKHQKSGRESETEYFLCANNPRIYAIPHKHDCGKNASFTIRPTSTTRSESGEVTGNRHVCDKRDGAAPEREPISSTTIRRAYLA